MKKKETELQYKLDKGLVLRVFLDENNQMNDCFVHADGGKIYSIFYYPTEESLEGLRMFLNGLYALQTRQEPQGVSQPKQQEQE